MALITSANGNVGWKNLCICLGSGGAGSGSATHACLAQGKHLGERQEPLRLKHLGTE